MNTQNPALPADPSPADKRVQPDGPLSGEVQRGGFVYFILCSETDRIKIGKASNVERRFKEIQTASPADLFIWAVFRARNPLALERKLHERWAGQRRCGEWFQANEDIMEFTNRFADTLEGARLWDIMGDGPRPKRPAWLVAA